MKAFIKKYRSELIITGIITILYLIYMIICRIHPFGDHSLFRSDVKGQYFEYWIYMKNAFMGKDSFIYSFTKSIGGNVFGIWAYYLLSPYNILFLISKPESYIDIFTLMTYLKILSASLALYAFSKYKTQNNQIKIFASIAYGLMGYVVAYQMNIMRLDGVILLPIIAIGVIKIIKENKFNTYIISLALALITNFYIGFEIFLFICMYFIYELILSEEKNKFKILLRFALYTAISIGIASIVIVPTYFVIKGGKGAGLAIAKSDILKRNFKFIEFLPKFLIGSETKSQIYGNGTPIAYCGILTLVLTELFLLSKKIKIKEKILTIIFILMMILIMNNKLLNLIFHGLKETTGYPYRYAFCLSFLLILASLRVGDYIKEIGTKELVIVFLTNLLIGIFMLMQNYKFIEMKYIIISMIMAATYILTILIYKKINIMPIIGLLLCIELLINYTFTFKELEDNEANLNTYMSSYAEFKDPVKEIIDNDKEFYRMEKTSNFYLNDSLMLNYKGISHSSSTFDKNVSDLLKKIGYSYYMDWPSYGRGNTIITDMLFNIKYKISNYEDEEYFKNERTYGKHHLLKNEKHLPLGFTSDGYIKKIEESKSPFEIQNKILNNLTNSNENYFKDVQVKELRYNNLNKINENVYQRKDESSNIELEINEIDNKNIYFYINTNYELDNPAFKIYVNNQFYDDYAGAAKNGILNINNKNKVNNIKIYFMTNEKIDIKKIQIKAIDERAFETAYTKIHQSASNIKYKNETLTMDVEAKRDGYLNIMLPNEYSWQIKIDGKETKQLSDSEFITVKINQGQHKIVMQYKLKGRKIGILLLVLSVIALITLNVYTIKRKKKIA
ncbi:MAG: YfhO family protein [Clostridiales bacterium]|nr:YfhO family protein [Clostridiales bacterium]